MIPIALMLAAAGGAQDNPVDRDIDQALECRVYVRLAQSVHSDPAMLAMDQKLYDYWLKRGDALGKKAGYSPETMRMKELAIPLDADKFVPVVTACLNATPKKALR